MKEQPKHVAAYEFYRDMDKRSYSGVTKAFSVSQTSVKKWAKEFKWKMRIATWDNAVREGVEAGALESLVDTRIEEIEQLSKAMTEIDAVMPMIFDALDSCTVTDEKTGEKHVRIVPETTQDMAALYNAQTRFVAAKVRLFETSFWLPQPMYIKHKPRIKQTHKRDPNIMLTKSPYCSVAGNGADSWSCRLADWQKAMGIDWMNRKEITQAIPPVYTEYIGKYLLGVL